MRLARFTFCLLVLAAASASAQDAPDSRREEARDALALAERQFEAAEFPLALDSFRRALELVAQPSIRLNMALCLERMGRYREATEEYAAALSDPELPASQVERANELEARASEQLATLVVTGFEAGTRVRVEGGPSCELPCALRVDPGSSMVIVDVQPEHRELVELTRGERRELPVDWTPPPPQSEPDTDVDESRRMGWLGGLGIGLATLGGAGVTGFGLRSNALRDEYLEVPTRETKRDGERARNLANASIAVMVAGAIALVVDLVVRAIRD